MKKKLLSFFIEKCWFLFGCLSPGSCSIILTKEFKLENEIDVPLKHVKKTIDISHEIINNIEMNKDYVDTFKLALAYNESTNNQISIDGKPFVSYDDTLFYLRTTKASLKILEYLSFIKSYIFRNKKWKTVSKHQKYKDFKKIIDLALTDLFFDVTNSRLELEASKYGKNLVRTDYDEIFILKNKKDFCFVVRYYQCGLYFLLNVVKEMLILDYKHDETIL